MNSEYYGLIAGGSGESLVQELHNFGKKTALVGGVSGEKGMNISDDFLVTDLADIEKVVEFFKAKAVTNVIIGTGHIKAFELANQLENNGFFTSIDYSASMLAKDKQAFKDVLVKNNLPTPKFYLAKSLPNALDFLQKIAFPCVIKSTIDKTLPQKANSEEEFINGINEVLSIDDSVMIEEYVYGIEVTVPVLANYDEVKALFVSYYSKGEEAHLKGFSGTKKQGILSKDKEEEILRLAQEAVAKTNMIGLCRLDIIVDELENPTILECNSVTVTGEYSPQEVFSEFFVRAENKKHNIKLAKLLVQNSFKIFEQKRNGIK